MIVKPRGARPRSSSSPDGFTLVELLVVIVIILLLTAAAVPVVMPALNSRRVNDATRIIQSTVAVSRDAAIRASAPRGVRLLPDPAFFGPDASNPTRPLAFNRMIQIEQAPDYSEGRVTLDPNSAVGSSPMVFSQNNAVLEQPIYGRPLPVLTVVPPGQSNFTNVLLVYEHVGTATTINNRTAWYWNVRVGEKIRVGNSPNYYTIVGPMVVPRGPLNPEGFVNVGAPGSPPPPLPGVVFPYTSEFLWVLNGQDDNGDGYIDSGFDGLDNNGNGLVDGRDANGGINLLDAAAEFENGESFIDLPSATTALMNQAYVIKRLPVVSEGSREVLLPTDVLIDSTTYDAPLANWRERSRLPVNPLTRYVDILIAPNGQVVNPIFGQDAPLRSEDTFYHFWVTERDDVLDHVAYSLTSPRPFLPLPEGTSPSLGKDRRLITLFPRTGMMVINPLETYDLTNVNTTNYNASLPYQEAQLGLRGAK